MLWKNFAHQGTLLEDRGKKTYCPGDALSFCALYTSLTFALPLLSLFPKSSPFFSLNRIFRFPWWRRTMYSELIAGANSWWSTKYFSSCVFLSFPINIRCFFTTRNNFPVLNNSPKFPRVTVRWQYASASIFFSFLFK